MVQNFISLGLPWKLPSKTMTTFSLSNPSKFNIKNTNPEWGKYLFPKDYHGKLPLKTMTTFSLSNSSKFNLKYTNPEWGKYLFPKDYHGKLPLKTMTTFSLSNPSKFRDRQNTEEYKTLGGDALQLIKTNIQRIKHNTNLTNPGPQIRVRN